MNDSVSFMREVNEFIANYPDNSTVIEFNKGNIGLGFIIRNWKEIHDENYSNQR